MERDLNLVFNFYIYSLVFGLPIIIRALKNINNKYKILL